MRSRKRCAWITKPSYQSDNFPLSWFTLRSRELRQKRIIYMSIFTPRKFDQHGAWWAEREDQFDKAAHSASVVSDAVDVSSPASDRAAKSPEGLGASLCRMTTSLLASSGSILLNASFQYQLRARSSFRHTETPVDAAQGRKWIPSSGTFGKLTFSVVRNNSSGA